MMSLEMQIFHSKRRLEGSTHAISGYEQIIIIYLLIKNPLSPRCRPHATEVITTKYFTDNFNTMYLMA
jgi:hypothetical protein